MIMRDYKHSTPENKSLINDTARVFSGTVMLAGMVYYILDQMLALF